MRIHDTLHTALHAVASNTSRSLLTMLGIIIGVGSVTLMTGIGKSMEGVILGQISILGPNNMVIFPGSGPENGGIQTAGFNSISFDDIEKLGTLKTIRNIAPVINVTEQASVGAERSDSRITATNPNYFVNYSMNPLLGRFFDESDEKASRRVAVLGSDAAEDLFFAQNPINKTIKIGSYSFTVIGVADSLGTAFFQNLDEQIYIPLSVGKLISNQDYINVAVFLRTVDADLAQKDVESFMRQINAIPLGDDDNFTVRNSQQAANILGSVSLGLTLFITFIAAISLIVGGIGIMNIMLVSVTERTREIGLRKAVGARPKDIARQFLVEAVVLTSIGGIVGIIGGMFCSFFIALIVNKFLADYTYAISVGAIITAMAMAMCTGFAFGVYPAKKAASLSPMEALRYE